MMNEPRVAGSSMPRVVTGSSDSVGVQDLLALLRPHQWVKNVVVFAGPAAGLRLFEPGAVTSAAVTFVSFCLAASGIYAINDVIDREADALHPTKCHRPIARGAITPAAALSLGLTLILASVTLAVNVVNRTSGTIVLLYIVTMLGYSLFLKKRVILDVIVLATGFVMRAWAGAASVNVVTSEWLIACVFTLCLFFGFGKRRCELVMMGDAETAGQHRATLLRYTPQLLDHLINVSAAIAVMTFLLYTMEPSRSPAPFHKEHLFFTLPIVVYGIFRYALLSELGTYAGPTEIMLKDRMMLASVILWMVIALFIAYHDPLMRQLGWKEWVWG